MAIKMGGAHIDENGKITGGKAGDQTGSEVCRRDWYVYSKGWDFAAFHPDANVRELHAQAVEQACDNDNVGYDQTITSTDGRNTLFKQAQLVNWIIKNIKTPCECDCSSLQDVAAICSGGVPADDYGSNGPATGSMRSWFKNHGYIIITASKYLSNSIYSLRGMVYVSEGHHTECALGNGSNYKDTLAAGGISDSTSSGTTGSTGSGTTGSTTQKDDDALFDASLSGTYVVTASSGLNIRYGIDKDVKVSIPKNTEVHNYGYYNEKNGIKWLYVQFKYNGVEYKGYGSSEWLSRTSSSNESSTGSTTSSTTGSTGSTSSNRPNYIVGNTYTLQCNLAVRQSPSKDANFVGYKNLTDDGKKHATDSTGYYLSKGTKVTCKAKAQKSSTETWIKTPSGYMCGFDSSQIYIK